MKQLKQEIQLLEYYLGKRVSYCSDINPSNQVDCWLLRYLDLLKKEYYLKIKRKKRQVAPPTTCLNG